MTDKRTRSRVGLTLIPVRRSDGLPFMQQAPILVISSPFFPMEPQGQSPCLHAGVPQSAVFLHKSLGMQAVFSA